MGKPIRAKGNSESMQRISEELRQLKQMSKALRSTAFRTLMARTAAQRLDPKPLVGKPIVLPAKPSSVAA